MSTYAIGDIQGCFTSLCQLLDHCQFRPAHDRLWFVGDLVNRGPRSLETLRLVRALGPVVTTVLGNHDLYLLMVAYGAIKKRNGDDTLDPILNAPDREELLTWLRHQPLCHTEGQYALVHAGILPEWSVKKARKLSQEVEFALQGQDHKTFLQDLWGSEPYHWSDKLKGIDRLRMIVNIMTRMRFCQPDGTLNFKAKGPPNKATDGLIPWFELPKRKSSKHTLVVGHWSALGLRLEDNLIALDTGCLWGGKLSALRLEDRQLFQVDCDPADQMTADF